MRYKILLLLALLLIFAGVASAQAPGPDLTFTPLPADIISDLFNGLSEWLVNTLNSTAEWLSGAFDWLFAGISRLYEWLVYGLNWIVNAIGTIANWFIAGINILISAVGGVLQFFYQLLEMLYHFVLAVIENILELVVLVALVLQALGALVGLVWSWLTQAVPQFFFIVRTLNDAPPTQIPGLPRCISAPMDSEICAVWYMTDYTIFAGEPGIWIVPLIVLIIDLAIVFYVIRAVLKFVRSFEHMTETVA